MKKLISKVKRWIKNFIKKTKRVIRYIPVIWNSYDFDYRYAIDLFQMKLEDIADFMESDKALSTEAKNDAKRIRTAIRLMKKVYDEEYATEYLDTMEELYGEGVNGFDFVSTGGDGENEMFQLKRKYEDWENGEEIKKVEKELFNKSYEKQQRAHKLLWEFIEHNIQRWWD